MEVDDLTVQEIAHEEPGRQPHATKLFEAPDRARPPSQLPRLSLARRGGAQFDTPDALVANIGLIVRLWTQTRDRPSLALPVVEQNFYFDIDGTAFARSSFQLVPNISPNGTAHGFGKCGKFRSDGIVTAADDARTASPVLARRHAAVTAACHRTLASSRGFRRADRETRWR